MIYIKGWSGKHTGYWCEVEKDVLLKYIMRPKNVEGELVIIEHGIRAAGAHRIKGNFNPVLPAGTSLL